MRSTPDFENILRVLARQRPSRPTLFEFFLNEPLYQRLTGPDYRHAGDRLDRFRYLIHAFAAAGYDYATVYGTDLRFPGGDVHQDRSKSLNEGARITDRASFEAYPWPDPHDFDVTRLADIAPALPAGMKLIVFGPGGVLENVIGLVGFDNLCFMLADEPELARDVCDAVGSRLVTYYEMCADFPAVGALISNDDWGFKTQTMLPPAEMRRLIFPWHRRIVETIHRAGKPAILHSCGKLDEVMDEIIDDMGYDAKHSYEDAIEPVEEAYERWGSRIAILGGIDVDFICRRSPNEVHERSKAMLERAAARGGYALGSGNSIPEYVPQEGYFAMISAVTEGR